MKVGDKVLVLLPHPRNQLKLECMGPFEVTKQVGDVDYEVATPGRRNARNIYHVNLMKKWHQPTETAAAAAFLALTEVRARDRTESDLLQDVGKVGGPELLEESEEDTPSGVSMLTKDQCVGLEQSPQEFPKFFSENPGRTSMIAHTIYVEDAVPIRLCVGTSPTKDKERCQGFPWLDGVLLTLCL